VRGIRVADERRLRPWAIFTGGLRSAPTSAIIVVTTAVFVLQVTLGSGHPARFSDPVFSGLAAWVPDLDRGQWWRLVTSPLLHLNWWHLFDNMRLLYLFGPLVGGTYGDMWLPVVYAGSAVAGVLSTIGVVHAWGPFAGASVAVFGVHGVVVVIAARRIHRPWMWTYLVGAVVSIAVEWRPYTVANFHRNQVHLYGLLAGVVLAAGYEFADGAESTTAARLSVTAGVIVVAFVIAASGWPHVPAHIHLR
jgi:rhomboid protease GluP